MLVKKHLRKDMESAIKIKNNSSSWYYNQPLYMRVARPNTEEYARQKQNDWYFRCQKEFENCVACGGSVWFPTLTFRNEDLPLLHLDEFIDTVPYTWTPKNANTLLHNSEPFYQVTKDDVIKCFDVRLVRRFIKTLRELLTRAGYNALSLQYLICAEYGKNTKRPHYHAILFIYDNIPDAVMIDLLRRAWHYGFIGHGKQGLRVKSTYALRYCTKYVSKDMYFSTTQKFKNVGLSLENIINYQTELEPKEFRKMLRDYMPRLVVSHGLGRCYFDNYLTHLPEGHLIPLLTKEKTIALPLSVNNQFTLPQYYINKFCYKIDKELCKYNDKTIALLTPLGEKVFSRKLGLRLRATSEQLAQLTPQICGEYWEAINSVDCLRLAQYITYLRYLPYRGEEIKVEDVFNHVDELIWSMCFDRKENHYVVEKWLDDAFIEIDNLEISGSCAEQMLDYACELVESRMCVKPKNWATWSLLPQFALYEKASVAYDKVMDFKFTENENKKRAKREAKADAKHECITKMPYLVTNYESY